MSDPTTLCVYAERGDDYVAMVEDHATTDPMIDRFITACRPGGRVLDLGCGPGQYARRMAEAGLEVEATDAVPEMVARAARQPGVTARQAFFDDLDAQARFDGIWASFSLLHAPRADFPRHLAAVRRALMPGGVLFLGMKQGTGGGPDRLGRHYEYYERAELEEHLNAAGLTPARHWTGRAEGLAAHPEGWIVIEAHA
jgi:SAM-dependent methyltransferase